MQHIAIVQGAPSLVIQELFAELVGRWRIDARIAGRWPRAMGSPIGL